MVISKAMREVLFYLADNPEKYIQLTHFADGLDSSIHVGPGWAQIFPGLATFHALVSRYFIDGKPMIDMHNNEPTGKIFSFYRLTDLGKGTVNSLRENLPLQVWIVAGFHQENEPWEVVAIHENAVTAYDSWKRLVPLYVNQKLGLFAFNFATHSIKTKFWCGPVSDASHAPITPKEYDVLVDLAKKAYEQYKLMLKLIRD